MEELFESNIIIAEMTEKIVFDEIVKEGIILDKEKCEDRERMNVLCMCYIKAHEEVEKAHEEAKKAKRYLEEYRSHLEEEQ